VAGQAAELDPALEQGRIRLSFETADVVSPKPETVPRMSVEIFPRSEAPSRCAGM